MKVWLDDMRAAPRGWTLTTTVDETVALLRTGQVCELSLDYDLDKTDRHRKGVEVFDWLEPALARGRIPAPVIHLHSMNPSGAAEMTLRLRQLEKRHGLQPMNIRLANPQPDRFNRVPGGLPDGDVELARSLLEHDAILLDVRTPQEYASGHLEGAVNVPHDQIDAFVPELDHLVGGNRDWSVVVYCLFGRRGADAKIRLMAAGFPNVLNVGGLDGLLGRPLVRGDQPLGAAERRLRRLPA